MSTKERRQQCSKEAKQLLQQQQQRQQSLDGSRWPKRTSEYGVRKADSRYLTKDTSVKSRQSIPDKDTVSGRAGEVARPLHLPVVFALAAVQLHADPHAGGEVSRPHPPCIHRSHDFFGGLFDWMQSGRQKEQAAKRFRTPYACGTYLLNNPRRFGDVDTKRRPAGLKSC